MSGPVLVCTFQDNETVRLSCWRDKGCASPDLRRGLKLALSAYVTRRHNGAHSTSLASNDVMIPPIVTAHFEDTDAVVLATYDEREIERRVSEQQHEPRRRSQGRRFFVLIQITRTMTGEWPFGDLPRGQAAALAVDPPWSYSCFSEKGKARSADRHYTTMASAAIEQLPVGELAARNAHLFLWVTGPCLVQGMHLPIMRAWGFEPSALAFVWIKPKLRDFANGEFFLDETLFAKGMGHTTRQNAEYVVLGRRGKPRRLRKDVHQLIVQPRREHSRKPDEFYARVQSYCAGPYVELFSRQRRAGWGCWGAELDKFEPEYDANADAEGTFHEAYAEKFAGALLLAARPGSQNYERARATRVRAVPGGQARHGSDPRVARPAQAGAPPIRFALRRSARAARCVTKPASSSWMNGCLGQTARRSPRWASRLFLPSAWRRAPISLNS